MSSDVGFIEIREQFKIRPEQVIRNAHDLSEHFRGRIGDGDMVPQRFAHLLSAVGADQEGKHHHDLRLLSGCALQVAAAQIVEGLVGSAELDIGFNGYAVTRLQQRVQQLVQIDLASLFLSRRERIALQHPSDRHPAHQFHHVGASHGREPFTVATYLQLFVGQVENLARLLQVRVGVGVDLCVREHRSGF